MIFPSKFVSPQSCLITSRSTTEMTEYGGVVNAAKRGNKHKWLIDLTTPPLNEDDQAELNAFIDAQEGRYGVFTMACPIPFKGPHKNFNTKLSAAAGANTLTVKNLSLNRSQALKAGDYISFSNHDKVYKVVLNANSNSSGEATLTIHPRLFSGVSANQSISEATFKLRLTKDENASKYDAKKRIIPKTITMIEA